MRSIFPQAPTLRQPLARGSLLILLLLPLTSPCFATEPSFWQGTWRSPVIDDNGLTCQSLWDVPGLIAEMISSEQNFYSYHLGQAEDLVQIWDDTTSCGATDDLGLAVDEEGSREVLAELFWGDTSYDSVEEALDSGSYSGTKAIVLELIETTGAADLYLTLQFQKYASGSCSEKSSLMSPDELTRVANFMSHLSMAFPQVKGWFIDDFMAHFCNPYEDTSGCLTSDETATLQDESEPSSLWLWSSSTMAPYSLVPSHVLGAGGIKLTSSVAPSLTATVDLSAYSTLDLVHAGSISVSFMTQDDNTDIYDPGVNCTRDGVLAVYLNGSLALEDFLSDGHDVPLGTDAEMYEGFELHSLEIPTLPLILNSATEVELTFALQLPSGDPQDYDPLGCLLSAGQPWQTLSTTWNKTVYLWDLEARVGGDTLSETEGSVSVAYSAGGATATANGDLSLDHSESTDGIILNISRNDGYVTEDEVERYVSSFCDRDVIEDCLINMRGTRWKDKDPDLDSAIMNAAAAYATGLQIGSAYNDLPQSLASAPGGMFTEITKEDYTWNDCEDGESDDSCKDVYDHVMTRHSVGQYGILGFYQAYLFDLDGAVDDSGATCDASGDWQVRIRDGNYVESHQEKLIFEWDDDTSTATELLAVAETETQTVAVSVDADKVLVALHQTESLSGKTAFVTFSVEDGGGNGCLVEGQYFTGAHTEAYEFYDCYADFFSDGVADCRDYGQDSEDYWDFDPVPFFDH